MFYRSLLLVDDRWGPGSEVQKEMEAGIAAGAG